MFFNLVVLLCEYPKLYKCIYYGVYSIVDNIIIVEDGFCAFDISIRKL